MPKSKDIQLQTLPVFEYRGQAVADSRDVAELIGKPHFMIMRQIKTMNGHFNQCNFASVDFFILAKKPYKEIYTDLQTRLSGIKALVSPAQPAGAHPALESGSGQGKDTTKAAKRGRKENEHE